MFFVLLKKQLAELFSVYFNKKNRRSGVLFTVIFILSVCVMGFAVKTGATYLCDYLALSGYGWLYFFVMGLVALFFGVFGTVLNTYNGLYRAKDNELLMSLPIRHGTVLTVRLVGLYLMGVFYELPVMIPAIAVYTVKTNAGVPAVLVQIFMTVLLGSVVLALSCFIGWAVAFVSDKTGNRSAVTVITSLLLISAYIGVYYKIVSFAGTNAADIPKMANDVSSNLRFLTLFGKGCVADGTAIFVFALLSVALFAVCRIVLSFGMFHIMTGDTSKVKRPKLRFRKKRSAHSALMRKELKLFFSTPAYMLGCGIGIYLMLLLAAVMQLGRKEVYELLLTARIFVKNFSDFIPVLAVTVVCFLVSVNPVTAPSVSVEGKSVSSFRALPVNTSAVFSVKRKLHILLNTPPAFVLILSFADIMGCSISVTALMLLSVFAYTVYTSFYGLALNLIHPVISWTDESEAIKQNPSVIISVFSGWALSVSLSVIYWFLKSFMAVELFLIVCILAFCTLSYIIGLWLEWKGSTLYEKL